MAGMDIGAIQYGGADIGAIPAEEAAPVVGGVFFENQHPIEQGMKPSTAAGLGGVLQE